MHALRITIILTLAGLLLTACAEDQDNASIVARVNGEAIPLSDLEYKYDLLYLDTEEDVSPTVERLRADYGRILSELITQKLVMQDLEQRGLAVTDNELKRAENEVRADYPEGAFEEMLVEEYVDLDFWRRQLHARLSMQVFKRQVLRPQVRIELTEAEEYYRQNIQNFYLPQRVAFLLVRAPGKNLLRKATELLQEGETPIEVSAKLKEVEAIALKMRADSLPHAWASVLEQLKPGQASGIMSSGEGGFERLILQERSPAKVLELAQAYPLIEEVLLNAKLKEAFNAWLEARVAGSEIIISTQLLPDETIAEGDTLVRDTEASALEAEIEQPAPELPPAGLADDTSDEELESEPGVKAPDGGQS